MRPYGMTKGEVARACVRSLWDSAIFGHFPQIDFHIIDDSSSEEFRQWFAKFVGWEGYCHSPIVHPFQDLGGDQSFAEALKLVESLQLRDEDYVYMVEDDYYHAPDCFWHFRDFFDIYPGHVFLMGHYQHLGLTGTMQVRQDGVLEGHDGPTEVHAAVQGLPPRHVLLTHEHFWVQQFLSTLTFMARMGTLRKHWATLLAAVPESNDAIVSGIYRTDPAYFPVPATASHWQSGCQSPYFPAYMLELKAKEMAKDG
jgi:hypothetical protein